MALFTGAFFVVQVSLIIVAKPFYAIFCTSCTGAFFVAQVSLIIVAKPFYAIFCTSCVPHHENPWIIVGKVVENVDYG